MKQEIAYVGAERQDRDDGNHRHHERDGGIAAGLQRVIIPIAQALDDLMHGGWL